MLSFLAITLLMSSVATAQESPEQATDALGKLPLAFIENRGQFDTPARFVVRHHGQIARFEKDAIVLQLTRTAGEETKGTLLRLGFEGASPQTTVEGVAQQRCRYNYFFGNDPEKWRTDVPAFSEVVYRRLQPGVDVRVRDNAGCLEYDLVLAPGADLSKVVIRVGGAKASVLSADGALALETELGTVQQTLPLTWLENASGEREPVECRYRKIDDERFGFEVAARDASRKLVIDPHLDWSTYLGGSNDEFARCVVVDSNGMVNVSGETDSADFPTVSGYSMTLRGVRDAFFARLDPTASGINQLVWATFMGAGGDEYGAAFEVDAAGVITTGGQTNSPFFPTKNAYQSALVGGYDGFLVRLDPSKTGSRQLVWSTFLGGVDFDFVKIPRGGVDANGIVTVTGNTSSKDFPTTPGAYSTTFSGVSDAIVARFDPSQLPANQLLYSTFLGGSNDEGVTGDAVDGSGRVYLCGYTSSTDFPTTSTAYSTTPSGGYDGWLALVDPSQPIGSRQLVYSTYFGGAGFDEIDSLCLDDQDTVYCAGYTGSSGLPTTAGAFDTTFNGPFGAYDAFVVHLDVTLTGSAQLLYSTFLGGAAGSDEGRAVVLGRSGELTVTGYTESNDFPVTPGAFQTTYNGGGDGFVVRLRPAGNGAADLTYATFLGGSGDDQPFRNRATALDANDFPVLTGITSSTNFPTTSGAYSTALAGGYDAFLTRLALSSWFNYGSGLAGSNGVPTFTSQTNPVIGNSLTLDLGNSLGANTPGLLFVGLSDANIPAAGGTLLVNAFLFLPIQVSAGGLSMNGSIPNDPLLTGISVYLQALEADSGAVHGMSFTPGLRLILGY